MTIVTIASQLGVIEYKLNILTEEQHSALDIARDNERSLFNGSAGTGKTMLALECARRVAQSSQRVGLLCFNVLLGNYLKDQTQDNYGITAGAFWPHILRPLVLRGPHRDEFLHDEENEADEGKLYDNVYPFYAELALTGAGPQFDFLIVDEAPDLCRSTYLDLMDGLLAGGLSEGCWAMLGDFSNQAIFPDSASEPVYDLFRISVAKARTTICRLVLSFRSQFFQSRRHFSSQAKDRSTTHLFGSTTKVCSSLRFTTSTAAPNRLRTPAAKGFPV